jgi:putative ABC transport system permease protein
MIKHMFKLVWNRKRTNILIITEIFFSFLVLFGVVAFAVYYANNYRKPLGFSYENIWNVSVGSIFDVYHKEGRAQAIDDFKRMQMALRDFNEVEGIAGIGMTPFHIGASNSDISYRGRSVESRYNDATDGLKDVLGLRVVQGRWFQPSDDALSYEPVVINEKLRDELFGAENPLGKEFDLPNDPEGRAKAKPRRVIGVITDFRQHGEFHALYNYCFYRSSARNLTGAPMINTLVKLRPGTTVAFEEKLMNKLRSVLRDRTIQIEPLARVRKSHMRLVLTPVIAASMIAVFLIIMVGLGMVGVLWQNVSRRTKEIGLRRALGGTAGDVHKQVLGELLVIATVGLLLGVAVVAQFPLLEIVDWMSPGVFTVGLIVSLLVMYALTIAAGLYPSWLATKVQPAGALHYE